MVQRSSNKIIMYPVDKKDAQTLIPLIEKHVAPGSRIFSDSWAAYLHLNELGYEHFSVTHKSTFKQSCRNVQTAEIVVCTTNRIERAWKISKDHFRRINGTNTAKFYQHLSEIIWRNHVHNENIYENCFQLVKSIFRLDCNPRYTYSTPLFPSWTPPCKEDEAAHKVTIIQESDSEEKVSDEVAGSSLDPSAPEPSQGTLLPDSGKDEQPITAGQRNSAHQDSDGNSENCIAHFFYHRVSNLRKQAVQRNEADRSAELIENAGAILIRNLHLYSIFRAVTVTSYKGMTR